MLQINRITGFLAKTTIEVQHFIHHLCTPLYNVAYEVLRRIYTKYVTRHQRII